MDKLIIKKKMHLNLERKKGLYGLIFIAPFIIGLLGFFIPAVVQSVIYSLSNMELSQNSLQLTPAGLTYYYKALFVNPDFVRTEVETISKLIFEIIVVIIYALFVAVILNQKMRGRIVIRAIFFMPVILATGIMSQIESQNVLASGSALLGQLEESISNGIKVSNGYSDMFSLLDITKIIATLRLPTSFMNFIFNSVFQIYDIVKSSGVQMIIFLAGLQSISPSIYEAAKVEGCSGWENFWKITLPMISPLIAVCTVWTIVESFLNPANKVMQLVFGTAFSKNTNYSFASAMAWLNFIAMAAIVAAVMAILKRFVFYENK